MMTDDMDLLREFARSNSQDAFAALVSRYVNLVYSVALRQVRDPHLAEEITQAVFIILAQKAHKLDAKTILPGWLCRTARYTGDNALKMQQRRLRREQEAYMQSAMNEPDSETWQKIAPLLDGAMRQLGRKDHDALVLRFFDGKSLREVGTALGANEEAAKKRVGRALEKLRKFFMKHGVASTTVIIAGAMMTDSIQAAPVALAQTATAIALTKGVAASGSILTLTKGALKLMAWTKAKLIVATAVGVLLAAGTTTILVEKAMPSRIDAYLQDPSLDGITNAPPMVVIQPTHFARKNLPSGTILGRNFGTSVIGKNCDLELALLKAYRITNYDRMIMPEAVRRTRVDFLVTVPDQPMEKLQAEIKRKFRVTAHFETRDTDVLLLKVRHSNAPGLTRPDNSSSEEWYAKQPRIGMHRHKITTAQFAELVESLALKPILDETDLAGEFDFNVGSFSPDTMNQTFIDQLGLELVPSREPVEMLVVEKSL